MRPNHTRSSREYGQYCCCISSSWSGACWSWAQLLAGTGTCPRHCKWKSKIFKIGSSSDPILSYWPGKLWQISTISHKLLKFKLKKFPLVPLTIAFVLVYNVLPLASYITLLSYSTTDILTAEHSPILHNHRYPSWSWSPQQSYKTNNVWAWRMNRQTKKGWKFLCLILLLLLCILSSYTIDVTGFVVYLTSRFDDLVRSFINRNTSNPQW